MSIFSACAKAMGSRRLARALRIAAMVVTLGPAISHAQATATPAAKPSQELAVPTTRVLAIGHFTAKATPAVWRPYLDAEVRQTLELYLAGKIEQWWVRPDQSGVVFLFDLDNPQDVKAMLDRLPLGRAGLMEFELIPLGPLSPLRLLLAPPAP